MAARDLGVTGLAAAKRAAFGEQSLTGGAMDRAVDPAAAEKRGVRRVDDGIDLERRDVGDDDLELARPQATMRARRAGRITRRALATFRKFMTHACLLCGRAFTRDA